MKILVRKENVETIIETDEMELEQNDKFGFIPVIEINDISKYVKEEKKIKAIKWQIRFIKNVLKEINEVDKRTTDSVWDLGPIETTYNVYTTLEEECQKIINELNIDFDMSEWHITKSVPKAIKLIEEKIQGDE